MEPDNLLNSELLEEVFNEIDHSEDLAENKSVKAGFLEDIINLEKESCCKNKKFHKEKSLTVEKFNWAKNTKEEKSVIHEGFTDSSDDEDNKYFEESSYNESGRTLKRLIKNKTDSKPDCTNFFEKTKLTGEKLKTSFEKLMENTFETKNSSINNGLLRDPILGMNIIKPLVSSAALKEKLIGRLSISTSKVKQFLETSAAKDANWVTGGAIVSKVTKTSQKGNQYCMWHVTDLSGDIKTICLFLFGSAYKEHWKNPLGTVVGILNPVILENNKKSEATLRIDNAQKILIMGVSKDYGVCQSKKKNGENCLSVVNKSKCNYCVYHMKKEYNKACRRSDLQPPKIGRRLDDLRAKILKQSHTFNNRKTPFTGVTGKKNPKLIEKDEQKLKILSQSSVFVKESRKTKDEAMLKSLAEIPEPIVMEKKNLLTLSKPEPQLIDLEFTVSKKERNAAKANALKYIREHGPIKKLTENKAKRTPEQIFSIKRRLEAEGEDVKTKKIKIPDNPSTNSLKGKYLRNGITDEFIKLMNSESRNNNILRVAETEEREKYFNKLEVREKLETKMASTFKVECKAVRCLTCNYKAFSASDLCKKEKHPLKVVNAVKRFWKCGICSTRTVCLELIPLHSCKTCGSSKWEKTSMMPEKKDMNLTIVPLSLRGDEEKYLGTATNIANLNLLVPE